MSATPKDYIDELRLLVECESPTDDLDRCRTVTHLATEIAARHLKPLAQVKEIDGRPVFWWGSSHPRILLLCHLDTVWPVGSFTPLWRETEDAISGPGIFDMKAGFLQAIYAVKDLANISDSVAIVATTDEETGSKQSRALIEDLARHAEAVLVLESSLHGKAKTGRKGTAMYRIEVLGRASHAGLEPEKGINATIEIAHLILQCEALENVAHGTTVVPTTVTAGTTTNTVPERAVLDLDIRSFSSEELKRVDERIRAMRPRHPEAKIEISGGINRPPLEESSSQSLYVLLEECAQELGYQRVGSALVGGASDGNIAAAMGVPTLDGLGAVGDGAHAAHEHITPSSIERQISLLRALIKRLIHSNDR